MCTIYTSFGIIDALKIIIGQVYAYTHILGHEILNQAVKVLNEPHDLIKV